MACFVAVSVDWEMVDWSVVMMTCKSRCLAPGPSRPWSGKNEVAVGGLALKAKKKIYKFNFILVSKKELLF